MITRQDVAQYVYDTLPWTEREDWDIDAIVDDVLAEWPDLLRIPPGTLYLGPDRHIEDHLDGDRYWAIVQQHQRDVAPLCRHCGGRLEYHGQVWEHTGDVAFPHRGCPDRVNPDNWK